MPRTVNLMTGILKDLSISREGRRLAASELEGSLNLTRLPLTPGGGSPAGPEEVLNSGQVIDRYPAFSPDGQRIAFASDRLGPMEIWILDVGTRKQNRLELPGKETGASVPFWSPDGKKLVVTRFFQDGTRSLWMAAADGSHAEELIPPATDLVAAAAVSPDGRSLLYTSRTGGFIQLFSLDLVTRDRRQLTETSADNIEAAWSPDGRWIVLGRFTAGSTQLARMPASGGREEVLTASEERLRHAFYSPDGRWIYVQPSHRNIYRMPATGGPLQQVTRFPESGLFIEEPALSADGRSLAYCRSNGSSSLWLLTLGDGP